MSVTTAAVRVVEDDGVIPRGPRWRRRVRALLLQLPEELREVVELRAGYAGDGSLSQQQVADRLGIGRRCVQSRELRALKALRALIESEGVSSPTP